MAAGRDIERWEKPEHLGGYSKELKVNIMAWYRLHNLVQTHLQDAAIEHGKSEGRKAQSKGSHSRH